LFPGPRLSLAFSWIPLRNFTYALGLAPFCRPIFDVFRAFPTHTGEYHHCSWSVRSCPRAHGTSFWLESNEVAHRKFSPNCIYSQHHQRGDSSAEIILVILYKIVLRAGAGQGHFLFCRTKLLPKAYPELIPFVNPGKSYNFSRRSGQMVRLIARPSGGLVCREAGDLGGRFYTSPDL
jgi:hypothetical protein